MRQKFWFIPGAMCLAAIFFAAATLWMDHQLQAGMFRLGLVLPLVTFLEYLTGYRTGIEGWFGVSFDPASPVAGRSGAIGVRGLSSGV